MELLATSHDPGRRNLEVPLKLSVYLFKKKRSFMFTIRIRKGFYLLMIIRSKKGWRFHQICHVIELGSFSVEMIKFLQPFVSTGNDHFSFCCTSLFVARLPFGSLKGDVRKRHVLYKEKVIGLFVWVTVGLISHCKIICNRLQCTVHFWGLLLLWIFNVVTSVCSVVSLTTIILTIKIDKLAKILYPWTK